MDAVTGRDDDGVAAGVAAATGRDDDDGGVGGAATVGNVDNVLCLWDSNCFA